MSVYRVWRILCDAPSCYASEEYTLAKTLIDVARFARRDGWTRARVERRLVDLCPTHSKPKAVVRKPEFVFAEWVPRADRPMGGVHTPISVATRPTRVWAVFPEGAMSSPDVRPTAKVMIHGLTARLEDEGHDWSWRDGLLRYNALAGPTWLYLEYE